MIVLNEMDTPEDQKQQPRTATSNNVQNFRQMSHQQNVHLMHQISQLQYYQYQQMITQSAASGLPVDSQNSDNIAQAGSNNQVTYSNAHRLTTLGLEDNPASQYLLFDQMQPPSRDDNGMILRDLHQRQNVQFNPIQEDIYQRVKSSPKVTGIPQRTPQHKPDISHQHKNLKHNSHSPREYTSDASPQGSQKQDLISVSDAPQIQDPIPARVLQTKEAQKRAQQNLYAQKMNSPSLQSYSPTGICRQPLSSPHPRGDQHKNNQHAQSYVYRSAQKVPRNAVLKDKKPEEVKPQSATQQYQPSPHDSPASQHCASDYQSANCQGNPQIQPYYQPAPLFIYQNQNPATLQDAQKKSSCQEFLNSRYRQAPGSYASPVNTVMIQSPQSTSTYCSQQSVPAFPSQRLQQDPTQSSAKFFAQRAGPYDYSPGAPSVMCPPQPYPPQTDNQFRKPEDARQTLQSHADVRAQLAYAARSLARSDLSEDERARLTSIKNDLEALLLHAQAEMAANRNYLQMQNSQKGPQSVLSPTQGSNVMHVYSNTVQPIKRKQQHKHPIQRRQQIGVEDGSFTALREKFQSQPNGEFLMKHPRLPVSYPQAPQVNMNTRTPSPTLNVAAMPQQNMSYQHQHTLTPHNAHTSPGKDTSPLKAPYKQHGHVIYNNTTPSPQKLRNPPQQGYPKIEDGTLIPSGASAVNAPLISNLQQHQHSPEQFSAQQIQGAKNFSCWPPPEDLNASPPRQEKSPLFQKQQQPDDSHLYHCNVNVNVSQKHPEQQHLPNSNNRFYKQMHQAVHWQQQQERQQQQHVPSAQPMHVGDDLRSYYASQLSVKNVHYRPIQQDDPCLHQQPDRQNESFAQIESPLVKQIMNSQKWYPQESQSVHIPQYDTSYLQKHDLAARMYYVKSQVEHSQIPLDQQQRKASTQDLKGATAIPAVPQQEMVTPYTAGRRRRSTTQRATTLKKQTKRRFRTDTTQNLDPQNLQFDRKQNPDKGVMANDLNASQLIINQPADISVPFDANISQFVSYPSSDFTTIHSRPTLQVPPQLGYLTSPAEPPSKAPVASEQPSSRQVPLSESKIASRPTCIVSSLA